MNKEILKSKFIEKFNNKDDLRFYFSPGRINLIGEHIDYNGGLVFPCAISLGTYAVLSPRNDEKVNLYSEGISVKGIDTFNLNNTLVKENNWVDYVKGVVSEIKNLGFVLKKGFDVYVYGNLPRGASVSSSASLELLFAEIIRDLNNLEITDLELVKVCQRAENNFVGLRCGIMDQFAIGMSKKNHAILLDCASIKYEYVPLELKDNVILIMNTNKSRKLVTSKYNERCDECANGLSIIQNNYKKVNFLCELEENDLPIIKEIIKNETVYKRVHHVVSEMSRVKKTYTALNEGNLVLVGELLNASHKSLKEDYEVTGLELDTIVELAQQVPGVLGARMIGAGFAGCAIAIVKKDAVESVKEKVSKEYRNIIGYDCDILVAETNDRTKRI
jgi:galactokinase